MSLTNYFFAKTKSTPAPEPAATARGKKILIIDDDAIIRKTTSMKLKAEGYDVATAIDGAGAISAARNEKPDLILLDLSFPPDVGFAGSVAWDGFAILSWLRGFKEVMNIPVIVITGGDPAHYKEQSLAKGARAFLHKPINPDRLLTMIAQTIEGKAAPVPVEPSIPKVQFGIAFSN